MPSLADLQRELRELRERYRQLRDAMNRGDPDADPDAMMHVDRRINVLENQIREMGGVPDPGTGTGVTPGGGGTPPPQPPAPEPPPPPAPPAPPSTDPVDAARRRVEQLRAEEPHPGVRQGTGTAEQLQAQARWRAQLDEAEQALAVAEGEAAFEAGGGLTTFTAADRTAIDEKKAEIARLQADEARVNAQIATYEAQLEEARRLLEANRGQTGGPSAGGAGAIAGGEAINARLRPLYAEQARLRSRMAVLKDEIAAIARRVIRAAVDGSGRTVTLPAARATKQRVETELLRRILIRLDPRLGPLNIDGTGLFARRRSGRRLPALIGAGGCLTLIVAVVLIVALVVGAVVVMNGDDDDTSVTGGDDDTAVVTGDDVEEIDDPEGPAVDTVVDGPPTRVVIASACATVRHTPPPGTQSLSQIVYALLLVALDGEFPDDTVVEVDGGGDAPASAPLTDGLAEAAVGISSYGSYPPPAVHLTGTGLDLDATGVVAGVEVGPDEGPVGGCVRPHDLAAGELAALSTQAIGSAAVVDFFDAFGAAHAAGDADALFAALDPASIERYGADQCQTYLGNVVGTLANPVVISARPEPWDYPTDGLTTAVPDAWTVDLEADFGGTRQTQAAHVRVVDRSVTWFTDCGDPR